MTLKVRLLLTIIPLTFGAIVITAVLFFNLILSESTAALG
jgi:hypothetical protein